MNRIKLATTQHAYGMAAASSASNNNNNNNNDHDGVEDSGGDHKKSLMKPAFPKLLCLKRPVTLVDDRMYERGIGQKNRNSFHQDVNEALNSLLWQPYEYQNQELNNNHNLNYNITNNNNNCNNDNLNKRKSGTPPPNSSSCASSCSSLTDLDGSFNKDSIECEENTDLNLCTEMVNNLKAVKNQSYIERWSCDQVPADGTSRLNSQTSTSELFNVCSLSDYSSGDVFKCNMQLEVPSVQPAQHLQQNILNISTIEQQNVSVGLNRYPHTLHQQQQQQHPSHHGFLHKELSKSSPGLSSVNVVGLPEDPRLRTTVNHPRNGSEPSTQGLIQHSRSSSVPKTNQNISNINVNFYRAVPVNVVSSVPTIQCLNTLDEGNNVSNVHIMPLGGGTSTSTTNIPPPSTISTSTTTTTQVTVHNPPPLQIRTNGTTTRTFTSTEAQTDEISVCPPEPIQIQTTQTTNSIREQRRKERRERRHLKRMNNHRHTVDNGTNTNNQPHQHHQQQDNRLPDLLNSHMPPPYTPLPSNQPPPPVMVPQMVPGAVLQTVVPNNGVPSGLVAIAPPHPPPHVAAAAVTGQVPLVQSAAGPVPVPVPPPSGFRFFPPGGFRRGRFPEEPPKGCCGLVPWKPGSLRWFIAVIALIAVCCVLVGTALGAMRPAGRDHLTVSLLMIGVGIVLVTVSGVAWRLTSHDSSTCRSMLGLGSTESVDVCTRRFVPRLPPSYGRPHHPYAAMMYPEFQYRPPPPSYQASMQEYRLRLLLLDRGNTPQIQAGIQNAISPPPTYRSHAGSLLRAPLSSRRDATQSEYSCPPSYRSQTSTNRQNTIQNSSVLHSREQSLSLSESNQESIVNVVNIEQELALDNITIDSLKMEPDVNDVNPLRMLVKTTTNDLDNNSNSKDGNLVTIVQTNDQNPVIVTVSGSSQLEGNNNNPNNNNNHHNNIQITDIPTEMEILAHL